MYGKQDLARFICNLIHSLSGFVEMGIPERKQQNKTRSRIKLNPGIQVLFQQDLVNITRMELYISVAFQWQIPVY